MIYIKSFFGTCIIFYNSGKIAFALHSLTTA